MYSIIYTHIYKHTRTQHTIYVYIIYITIYNIHIHTVHGIHGWFAINESMDKIQEKYRQRASNCCFPQSSHLLLYINIKYQYIPVPSVVRRATRSSIRAMNPGNMDSPIWMVSCYSSQEKSSQIIAN